MGTFDGWSLAKEGLGAGKAVGRDATPRYFEALSFIEAGVDLAELFPWLPVALVELRAVPESIQGFISLQLYLFD